MFPGTYNLRLYRGDSYAWQFRLWADAAHVDPVDLTGVEVEAELRDKPRGTIIVDLGCAVTLPNIIDVTLPAEGWETIPATAAWDLQLTFADDRVQTVVMGKVTITDDVTDSTPVLAGVAR